MLFLSAASDEGEEIHPQEWKNDFIQLPKVCKIDPRSQLPVKLR
jgi:hypothetical protein